MLTRYLQIVQRAPDCEKSVFLSAEAGGLSVNKLSSTADSVELLAPVIFVISVEHIRVFLHSEQNSLHSLLESALRYAMTFYFIISVSKYLIFMIWGFDF